MKQPPVIIVQLIHIFGPLKGQIQDFSGPVISIGRHLECNLRFPGETDTVSRKHADIVREGNQFKIVDHSANGTFVNGKQIKEAILKDGDVLEFSKGGPKVSFLAQIREGRGEKEIPWARPVQPSRFSKPPRLFVRNAFYSVRSPTSRTVPPEEPEVDIGISARPLIIQYGPTFRSFKQLPITIGRNSQCDFKMELTRLSSTATPKSFSPRTNTG